MKITSSFVLWSSMIFIVLVAFFYYPRWEQRPGEATLSYDVAGYYSYLPATFIYKDLKHCQYTKDSSLISKYNRETIDAGFIHQASGNYVLKYASGQALLMSPYFFIAHYITTHFTQYPADGFSLPYQRGIGIGMLLYGLIGLYYLRKVLLYYFPDWLVSVAILTLVLGTNYLNYVAIDTGMTHSVLFTIYTLVMYRTILFYKKPNFKNALIIGLLIGLATLIRPTEIIALLLPLLWDINSIQALKKRIAFLWRQIQYPIATGIGIVAFVSIQLIYWKWVSGDWIVYSYQDQGFSWLHPHVYAYALEYRCGWLRLCPMMLFAFLGIIPLIKSKTNTFALLSFFVLNFYIVTAWDIWDYGGTGGRAMVQSYPVLTFCIASLILWVQQYRILKWLFYTLYALCLYINIWWTHNAHRGSVQVMDMSNQYYWAVLGKWKVPVETKKYLDNKDIYWATPSNSELLYTNDFEKDSSANCIQEAGNHVLILDQAHQNSKEYEFSFDRHRYRWLRTSCYVVCGQKEWNTWEMAQIKMAFFNNGAQIKDNFIRVYRVIEDGFHGKVYLDARVPDEAFDAVRISFYNAGGKKKMSFDSLRVIGFN